MTHDERVASAIGRHGIRDLDAYGLVAVDKARLEQLERLYKAVENWRHGLIDKHVKGTGLQATYPAVYRLAMTFDELEAMSDEPARDS